MVTEFSPSQTYKQPSSKGPPSAQENVWSTSNSKSLFAENGEKKAEFKPDETKGGGGVSGAPKPGTKYIKTVKRTKWGFGRRKGRNRRQF